MSNYDLLKGIIDDLNDTIEDYEDSRRMAISNLDKYNYKVVIHELRRWKRSLETMLLELED